MEAVDHASYDIFYPEPTAHLLSFGSTALGPALASFSSDKILSTYMQVRLEPVKMKGYTRLKESESCSRFKVQFLFVR